jgi:hypothetical protein
MNDDGPRKGFQTMAKKNKLMGFLFSTAFAASTALTCAGCEIASSGTLEDATAVQLETALISMIDSLMQMLIYNAMDIPATAY